MATATLVQYVAIRRDLLKVLKWPVGAVITQACHACSAVVHIFHEDANTQAYLTDIDRMHKIIVEVTDETELRQLSEHLSSNGIEHKLWIEQPENIATCLATKPYARDCVKQFFSSFKLFR